jgi:WD40 repeat protein
MLNFQNIDTIDTFENLKGIFSITFDQSINLLAYPDKANGYVKIRNYDKNETILINAHSSKLVCITISQDGKFIATASEKGTFIRLFRTFNGELIQEYRVAKNNTEVHSIVFDNNVQFMACSASNGTISVYSMATAIKKNIDYLEK